MFFATCTTGVWSRPKLGTSCFSSLIGTIPASKIPSCVFHLFYSFSIGFVVALHIKEYRKTAFWRTKMLIPLFVVTLLIPLVSVIPPVEVPFIAFGTGNDDVDLYRELDRKSPLCDLYDFRKLSQDADGLVPNHSRGREIWSSIGRQAMNYGIVVGSFVAGAISVAILMHFIHQWAIWLITVNLFLIMTYYTARVKQLGLQTDNL